MGDAGPPSALAALNDLYAKIPFEYLLVGHCLIVSAWFPFLKNRYMLSYWVGLSAAFGGGIVSSLLIQDPKRAPIALFSHNVVGVTWTICWWLVNYFPFNLVGRIVLFFPVRIVLKACLNILRAGLIAQRVNLAVQMFPGVWAAPIVIGTVGGSGGKIVIDAVLHSVGVPAGPAEMLTPGFPIRSGFSATLIYWFTVHIYGHLTAAEGHALIVTLFVIHGILSDLFGSPLDFTYLPARIAHALVNVPMPGLEIASPSKASSAKPTPPVVQPAPVKPAKAAASTTSSTAQARKAESKKGQ